MTMQHISAPASRVVSLAAHRRLSDAKLATIIERAPIRPRSPRSVPLSLFLLLAVVAIALAFALAVALSDHLIARTTVELARAALASTEAGQ